MQKRMSLRRASSIIREMKHYPSTGAGFVDVEPSHSESYSEFNDETESEEEMDDDGSGSGVEVMRVQS